MNQSYYDLKENSSASSTQIYSFINNLYSNSLERIPLILVNIPFMIKFYLLSLFCKEFRRVLSEFLRIRFYLDFKTFKKRIHFQRKIKQNDHIELLEEQFQNLRNRDDNKTINFSLDDEHAHDANNIDNKIKLIKIKSSEEKNINHHKNKFIFKCCSEYNSYK